MCSLPRHAAVSDYDLLDIFIHACYDLNEKFSSWTRGLTFVSQLAALFVEAGEPSGGEGPLAESKLLGTDRPLKVKPGPWLLSH